MEYRGYTARVIFDEEAGLLFGEVEGLRDVVTFEASNVEDLKGAFRDSVEDYLAMCAERDEAPEKPYSGKFLVRVDPKLHREVAMAAARSGKSLNAFASDLMTSSIQRERKPESAPKSVGSSRTGARGIAEEVTEYLIREPELVIAEAPKESVGWDAWTADEAGSTTPARRWNTPPAQRIPISKTPSSGPHSKKAA